MIVFTTVVVFFQIVSAFLLMFIAQGLTSDSDILSESMRWMGEPRFSVAGAYFLLKRLEQNKLFNNASKLTDNL